MAKQVFNLPYAGIDNGLLIGANGEISVVIKITNPVIRYSAAAPAYDEFHQLLINMVKILGDGYILQKQDVISRGIYPLKKADEYLQQKYNDHFSGRRFLKVDTYLTITRQVKKGSFYVYDARVIKDFRQATAKVMDVLDAGKTLPKLLDEKAVNLLVMQILAMDFSRTVALDNITPTETELKMGRRSVRNISLVNIDDIDLPLEVSSHIELNEKDTLRGFPVDFLSFLFKVPDFDAILFNAEVLEPHASLNSV